MQPYKRLTPQQLLRPGLLFGLGMIVLGGLIHLLRGGAALPGAWYPLSGLWLGQEILIGASVGVLGIWAAWTTTNALLAGRQIRALLINMIQLERVNWGYALMFGLVAGFPEEILFRGAIQPILGLVLTALLFGLLHALTPLYAVYATLAGLVLGGLAAWRGDLWAATVAHLVYDAGLFILMARWARAHSRPIPPPSPARDQLG